MILALIQLGGLGVTTYAGILVLLLAGRFTMRGREFFALEVEGITERDVRRLLRRVALYAAVCEGASFLLLLPWSLTQWGVGAATWHSLFHSISAFNNAGFDLMGGGRSFGGQAGSPYPLLVLATTSFLGSISFITVLDLPRRPRRWALDTRLVVVGSIALLGIGVLGYVLGESQQGRVLDGLAPHELLANALFLAVNARTTGMASIDMAQIRDSTTVLMLALMFIGGVSTSTASGIKVGTFMVLVVAVRSALRGQHRAQAFNREIPLLTTLRATSVALLGVTSVVAGAWLLELTEHQPFLPTLFEVVSALGNVGWSQGVTPGLSHAGVAVVVALMFVGRLGPLIVTLSIPERPQEHFSYARGWVRVG